MKMTMYDCLRMELPAVGLAAVVEEANMHLISSLMQFKYNADPLYEQEARSRADHTFAYSTIPLEEKIVAVWSALGPGLVEHHIELPCAQVTATALRTIQDRYRAQWGSVNDPKAEQNDPQRTVYIDLLGQLQGGL